MKTAILYGSTGFVGSSLLTDLLNSPGYTQVTAVTRKSLNLTHPKLKNILADYTTLATLKSQLTADEIFITLGTTKKITPNEADYYRVDHDYPVLAAKIAKESGAESVFLLTAVGADPSSKFFYTRTKGETERDIAALNFEHTHIFRPSMIMGNRKERRSLLEEALMKYWSALKPLLAWADGKYKGITAEDIAKSMINSARNQTGKLKIYHWKEMQTLATL